MENRAPIQWMGGVLAASSLAALLAIIAIETPSVWLKFACKIFSVSIPLNAFIFLTPTFKTWDKPHCWSKNFYGLAMLSFLPVSIAGFAALFAHFSQSHVATFLVSCALLYSLFVWRGHDIAKGK